MEGRKGGRKKREEQAGRTRNGRDMEGRRREGRDGGKDGAGMKNEKKRLGMKDMERT